MLFAIWQSMYTYTHHAITLVPITPPMYMLRSIYMKYVSVCKTSYILYLVWYNNCIRRPRENCCANFGMYVRIFEFSNFRIFHFAGTEFCSVQEISKYRWESPARQPPPPHHETETSRKRPARCSESLSNNASRYNNSFFGSTYLPTGRPTKLVHRRRVYTYVLLQLFRAPSHNDKKSVSLHPHTTASKPQQ